MTVCPKGKRSCGHKTNKIRLQPSDVCWWWHIGWCNDVVEYDGTKPKR